MEAQKALGDITGRFSDTGFALIGLALLPDFLKSQPFPIPFGLTLGLVLSDLFLRRA